MLVYLDEQRNAAHQVGGERVDEAALAKPGVVSHCEGHCAGASEFRAHGLLHADEDPWQVDAPVKEYILVQHHKCSVHCYRYGTISSGLSYESGVFDVDSCSGIWDSLYKVGSAEDCLP